MKKISDKTISMLVLIAAVELLVALISAGFAIIDYDPYELYQTTNLHVLDLRDFSVFTVTIKLSSENDQSYRFIESINHGSPSIRFNGITPAFVDALYNVTVTNFNTEPYVTIGWEVLV